MHFPYIDRSVPKLQDLCLRSIVSCDTALPIDLLPTVFQSAVIQFALNRHSAISSTISATCLINQSRVYNFRRLLSRFSSNNQKFIIFSSQLHLPNETMWSDSFIFPAATLVNLQSLSFYKCDSLTKLSSALLAKSGLNSLKSLSVRSCPLVTDEILAILLSAQRNL